jgi:hypothetical protein
MNAQKASCLLTASGDESHYLITTEVMNCSSALVTSLLLRANCINLCKNVKQEQTEQLGVTVCNYHAKQEAGIQKSLAS